MIVRPSRDSDYCCRKPRTKRQPLYSVSVPGTSTIKDAAPNGKERNVNTVTAISIIATTRIQHVGNRKSLGFRAKPAPKSSSAAFVPPVARRLQDLKNKPKLTMPMSPKLASKARSQRRSLLGENNTAMQN